MFSGDKLLGGPQAGIAVGRRQLIEPMRRHPLMRALRPDKLCLAALVSTLRLWRDDPSRIPLVQLASVPAGELEQRARSLAERANARGVEAIATVARIGGGAAPLREIPSWGLRVKPSNAMRFAARLREGDPPIVARIEDDAVVLDLRCIFPADDDAVMRALLRVLRDDD
jgi:L-seryl-tRNA(Ser) seleniumtransferase